MCVLRLVLKSLKKNQHHTKKYVAILSILWSFSFLLLFDTIKDSNYSRDYWHLSLICDTCGNFSQEVLKKTKNSHMYFSKKAELIDYEYPNESRLDRKINELNIESNLKNDIKRILTGTLQIDSNKRWTIDDLLKDNFFSSIELF
jgi:serine/threonine protein kinase